MTTGWRLAVRCPRPTTGPACAARGDVAWGACRPGPWRHRGGQDAGPGRVDARALCVRGVSPRDEARPLPLAAWQRWFAVALSRLRIECSRSRRRAGVGVGPCAGWWPSRTTWGGIARGTWCSRLMRRRFAAPICASPSRCWRLSRVLTILSDDPIATWDAWVRPDPGGGAGPHPRGRPRQKGGVRERAAARLSSRDRLGGPLSHHSGRDGPAGRDAPSRTKPHQEDDSAPPLIQGVDHRRPRPQEALSAIQATYPALGPLHALKEDGRTLIHAPDFQAATAPRHRGLINAEAA